MHAPSYYVVHASKEHLRDGADAVNTGGDVGELEVTRLGKVAIEDNVVVVDDGTDDGSHGNAAVLALNGTTTLEGLGLSLEPAEGIVNAEGLGDTKLELRDGEVGSDPAGLGRGKRGGRSSKKGGNGELHHGGDLVELLCSYEQYRRRPCEEAAERKEQGAIMAANNTHTRLDLIQLVFQSSGSLAS